jgi:virginiamycin B lyase
MSIRNSLNVFAIVAALSLGACGGGGNGGASGLPQGQSSPTPSATAQTATRTYQLSSTAASYDLPPLGGFTGSLAFPTAAVPAGTSLELTSSLDAPGGTLIPTGSARKTQATGTLNVYYYATIRLSSTVTFSTLPGFSVALPATVKPAGLQFFYAISIPAPTNGAVSQDRTEGPATVSGANVTFTPSATPLTLLAGKAYTIAFYAISPVVRPTPAPTPTRTPGPQYSFTEFQIANLGAQTQLTGIATGPDGALWFTEYLNNRIGRLTTGGAVTEYPLPTAHTRPVYIAAGPDRALWFTEDASPLRPYDPPYGVPPVQIGRITTGGNVTEYPVPLDYGPPQGITAGPDGAMWFTTRTDYSTVGRITMTGSITLFDTGLSLGDQIVTGPDGALWATFSSYGGQDSISRITTGGVATSYLEPTVPQRDGPDAGGITVGPDGALWFTYGGNNSIGRITTAGVATQYPLPTPSSNPGGITAGPDGALWFTEDAAIGRITTAGKVTEFPLPNPRNGAGPGITIGPDGALWFTEPNSNTIGRMQLR